MNKSSKNYLNVKKITQPLNQNSTQSFKAEDFWTIFWTLIDCCRYFHCPKSSDKSPLTSPQNRPMKKPQRGQKNCPKKCQSTVQSTVWTVEKTIFEIQLSNPTFKSNFQIQSNQILKKSNFKSSVQIQFSNPIFNPTFKSNFQI